MQADENQVRVLPEVDRYSTRLKVLRETGIQLIRFAIVGAVATSVHAITALSYLAHFGETALLANTFGYLAALSVSFCGNMFWVFPHMARLVPAMGRFFLISFIAFSVTAAVSLIFDLLSFRPELSLPIVLLVAPGVSFVGNRFWVFRERQEGLAEG